MKHLIGADVPGRVKLDEVLNEVSKYWPATTPPNRQLIHIIVQLPSGKRCVHWVSEISLTVSRLSLTVSASVLGKRSRAAQNPFWLQELHSKIWDRNDLIPTLFREVKVTRAHYDELQDRLNQKYPDRHSKEYAGHALSDNLDFLNSLEAFLPRHSDNNDRINDDDMEAGNGSDFEIDSFFPSTLCYLDLSTLELKRKSNRFPLPLFRRQEYGHISELIDKRPLNGLGSVMVSGQPGTGEVLVSPFRRI